VDRGRRGSGGRCQWIVDGEDRVGGELGRCQWVVGDGVVIVAVVVSASWTVSGSGRGGSDV
jgi:hypothetical protein